MLKGRGRDLRSSASVTPGHLTIRPATQVHRTPLTRPEPDYEVVEFPSEQYVNAKLQPPPPPPPRPPTGHPVEAASCGLCGGGGARVRCAECGRRALCASCDDMYHRHPKRRHHQRQALTPSQLRDERPPLPPKAAPPVPPPRRHKISGDRSTASPRPSSSMDQRQATLGSLGTGLQAQTTTFLHNNHITSQIHQPVPTYPQPKISPTITSAHLGSMPYLPTSIHHAAAPVTQPQVQSNTIGHASSAWGRPRGSLPGFNLPSNLATAIPTETWENPESVSPTGQCWGRPMRRGTSVLELGGGGTACAGCPHCASMPWRYGSCANLDHPWLSGWPQSCYPAPHVPPHTMRVNPHLHPHPPQTPQPYRRAESRAVSRAASRAGSRAASPAMSVRSRVSRRGKHRTPSPPPVPSSDADSESESESDENPENTLEKNVKENSLGPAPPPPTATWQCEHCTFVNEPGVRVCTVCCRTPTTVPKIIAEDINNMERLKISDKNSPSPIRTVKEKLHVRQNGERNKTHSKKERASTACGPSPPRDLKSSRKPTNRLVTPIRDQNENDNKSDQGRIHHDMAVGPSPPREVQVANQIVNTMSTPPEELDNSKRQSPNREAKKSQQPEPPKRHVSVGPSPPRESTYTQHTSVGTPPSTSTTTTFTNTQKKSTGTSPPHDNHIEARSSSTLTRTNVSNTGTSPPPQSISTQTYEVPNTWERAPSVSRSRQRRRLRDESRRERSHSRHSLSSDTRESDRSVRTSGGRWEWREPRDSSPGGEWSENERRRASSRLTRRASHLDLRRTRSTRRPSFYGSEAASPEPMSATRAISLEALAGPGIKREAEKGLELARLLSEAERSGFSAAEVHAALAQNPVAPLSWLRERWPSLCAGVRAAAARLAAGANITELEARAALAKHRGAMWPAVTDCVEKHRRQTEIISVGEEGRLRGHVWGSPVGVDDEAEPPPHSPRRSHRTRAEDSSDEYEVPTPTKFQDDDWMYLPLETNVQDSSEMEQHPHSWNKPVANSINDNTEDIAQKLKYLLIQAGIPSIDENLLLNGLLANGAIVKSSKENNVSINHSSENKPYPIDLGQSENDFIDAYNALTKSSPLPNNDNPVINSLITNNNLQTIEKYSTLNSKEEINFTDSKVLQSNSTDKPNLNILQVNQVTLEGNINLQTSKIKQPEIESISKEDNTNTVTHVDKENYVTSNNKISSDQFRKENSRFPSNLKSLKKIETNEQEEEKSTNLNEIVDNTQKLIQQMKEEINSDINSLDGRTMSQSEADNSSNESDLSTEHDSTYSNTDDETEDLTSDEKESLSIDNENSDNEQESSQKSVKEINRTSSEDNEQFEEAMDHLDGQLDDFKQKNIEMLDSIARSLQEEQTFSVEINDQKTIKMKKQDFNNNFAKVNSFEEIYDELTDTDTNNQIQQKDLHNIQDTETDNSLKTKDINYMKQEINTFLFKPSTPAKVIITENIQPSLNALIEHIKESLNIIDMENKIYNNKEIATSHNDLKSNAELLQETEKDSNSINSDNLHNENTMDNVLSLHGINSINITETDNDNTLQNESENIIKLHNNDDLATKNKISSESNNFPEQLKEDTTTNNISFESNNLPEQLKEDTQSQRANSDTKNISPEKTPSIHTYENTDTKTPGMTKSNIPKLIKVLQSNKPKVDKTSPKIIASKVPIRRASIKQHPAPAPPKTHFGNIQSGHVKQLQTRLFNSKNSKGTINNSVTSEIKASTSTLNKKKPAPPPPVEIKQHSPPKLLPPKEKKKQYFRETCRTEDEWTESDSEDSQIQIVKSTEEPQRAPPSPPPPITLRRISGQLIDLAAVHLPEGSPERQARMLLAEGATENWEQAQMAVELISRGADPPAALLAALECADLSSALAYLHQDCELCASKLPEHEMVSMLRCIHRCCRECAHHYFTVQITERSIADCVCPYCKMPELENLPEDSWLEYFAHLDILLKTLLESDVHELFQRKLRDRTLARDPNFRWCVECSSGFFVHPKQKKVRCPECRSVSCASCRKQWSSNHEGLTCEQYAIWLEDNDQERSVAAVQQHLRENGLECPRCHFKYSLSRGGCMHFTCTQCKYEFCYGCGKPFMMGAQCGLSDYCAKLGLHAHHPRNCLFYLRDKEPHELQTLLQMNNVTYETETPEGGTGRCPTQLQRETPTGLVDGACGGEVPPKHAGLCKVHYVEYLAGLARGLDPIPIMEVSELVAELRRRALPLPERGPWDTDPIYAGMCAEIVKEKIPLD